MTINDIENFSEEVKDVIKDWFKNEGFKARKLTDTPTDDLQVVNKKYVDDHVTPPVVSSPGLVFVSYTTAATGSTFTVSGLDLAVAKQYQIIVDCRNVTNTGVLTVRVNNDGTAGSHQWTSQAVRYAGGATETNAGDDAGSGVANWSLNGGAGSMSMHCVMNLGYNNALPLASFNTASIGKAGDPADVPCTTNGTGFYNSATNITSLVFAHNSGTNCQWAVWVFKSAQS